MFKPRSALCTIGLLAALATGCGAASDESTADLEGVPELGAIELALTGDVEAEGLATEEDAVDPSTWIADELEAAANGAPASDLDTARHAVRELNQALRDALVPIVAMVRNTPPDARIGAVRIWGPVERGATEYRFLLRHAAAGVYGWRLEARVADSEATFARVAAGRLTVGAVPRRGVGVVGFDLDALGALDATVAARGLVLAGFAHGELGTTVRYALRDFSRSEALEGIDALYDQVRLSAGVSRVRLAYRGDLAGSETSAEELVLARVRHQRGLGGRSDSLVSDGDVGDEEVRVVSQCWNAELESVYRVVRSCPLGEIAGEGCETLSSDGDVADCPSPFAEAELPPQTADEPMSDDQDPNDVAVPSVMPDVEGVAES